jgi:hypothetical protein
MIWAKARHDDAMEDQRLSSARWHIDRYDKLRTLTASRAAVLLSANALILAVIALLAPLFLQESMIGGRPAAVALSIAALIVVALVSASVSFALAAMLNVRPSRKLFAADVPPSLVYSHGDTLRTFQTFAEFEEFFDNTFIDDELRHATSALWSGLNAHGYRFQRLRRATWLLYFGIVGLGLFAASVIVVRLIS